MSGSSLRTPGPSRQPSLVSTASAVAASAANAIASSSSQRLRRLTWDATIPLFISVECDNMPNLSLDRSIESHYIRAPRISYLPLILQQIKGDLLSLMMDEASLSTVKDEDYCFFYEGTPLRWHWPIGLLYDYHTANNCPSSHRSNTTPMTSLTAAIRRLSSAPGESSYSTSMSDTTTPQPSHRSPLPWRLTLRIGSVPNEKLHSSPGLESCRSSFMSMLKEADFVRWGSTKRVTNLRKTEQDALWEGVVTHNFDTYWSVASKIIPAVPATSAESGVHLYRAPSMSGAGSSNGESGRPNLSMHQTNESQASFQSAAPSESNVSVAESTTTTNRNGSNQNYRSLPMRFYLIEGAPVVQEPIAPYMEDGRPMIFHSVLSALFPLLFPPTPTFSTSSTQGAPPPLAYAVIQGIRIPFDAEIPWIGSALSAADGWISVCIHLLADGEMP